MADTETVTIVRPPGRDAFGDPVAGSAVQFEVPGCRFAPGPSREMGMGTNQVDTDGTVYAPPATDVRATDQVLVRGVRYNVVGDPQDWGGAGIVIVLRKFT